MASFAKPLSERIWRGDRSTVDELRAAYEAEPEANLLPYACVLYSFRARPECRENLKDLGLSLLARAKAWRSGDSLNEADMLSTYLMWLARQASDTVLWSAYHMRARELCLLALDDAEGSHESGHTQCLLGLTLASLAQDHQNFHDEQRGLLEAKCHHAYIKDPKQMARVYRGLAMLYRRMDKGRESRQWFFKALGVRGVPLQVHIKTIAALMGKTA